MRCYVIKFSELLDRFEEQCVNSTGIPLELVNARYSTDFATQITMSNIKFLRHCILRQEQLENYFSRIITALYAAEYGERVYIKCVLPQPLFLSITKLNNNLESVSANTEIWMYTKWYTSIYLFIYQPPLALLLFDPEDVVLATSIPKFELTVSNTEYLNLPESSSI